MNIVHDMILHACWQEENEAGIQTARPWLRWFLARVLGMKGIPVRESETKQREREQWLAVRKEEGLRIDPETAEIFLEYGSTRDPYGLYDLTGEEDNTGRNYFARSPGSEVWVSFRDLSAAVCDRLWARCRAGDFRRDDDDLAWLFCEEQNTGGCIGALRHFAQHPSSSSERRAEERADRQGDQRRSSEVRPSGRRDGQG